MEKLALLMELVRLGAGGLDPSEYPDTDDLRCLGRNIYHEARGESVLGQMMVAQVTLNRVESDAFPDSVCEVVWQPGAFSWTNDGRRDVPGDAEAYEVALEIAAHSLLGWVTDVSGGATFYYNPEMADPFWASHPEFVEIGIVGRHRFMAQVVSQQ